MSNIADYLLAQLVAWGVKTIFGVSGDAIFPLLDALSRQDKIRYISAGHETAAAFMAAYEAKLTGRLGVCTATSGPGAVNLVNGLADAYFDQAPLLALTGQVETKKIGTRAKQYFEQNDLFRSFTGYSALVLEPTSVPHLLSRAVVEATTRETATHLALPRDLLLMPLEANLQEQLPASASPPQGEPSGDLEKAAQLLQQAQRPLIVVGRKAKGVKEQVLELASRLGAAVITAQEAQGIIPYSFPQALGGIGEGYLPDLIQEVDCILLLGSASYEEPYFPPAVPVIQVEAYPWRLREPFYPLGLAGDFAAVLAALLQKTAAHKPSSPWLDGIFQERIKREEIIQGDLQNPAQPIHPARLMALLQQVAAKDAVITCDEGEFLHWFDRGFLAGEQEILAPGYWRSMGSGIPAAIAAKLAHPHRQVLALVGDGGMLMSLGEIPTLVRYQLPVTIVVVNNHMYGLEKQKMAAARMNPFGVALTPPDFALVARACGAQGFTVSDPGSLEAALTEALACGQPAVVDINCAEADLPHLLP